LDKDRTKQRIASLDTLRFVAVFGVVAGHAEVFREGDWPLVGDVFSQVVRFCIPYFFAVSGYFFARKIKSGAKPGATLLQYLQRLLLIFVAWSVIYGVRPSKSMIRQHGFGAVGVKIAKVVRDGMEQPWNFLLEGTREHLWFLPALMLSLAVLAIFLALRRQRWLLCGAALLYVLGMLAGAYADAPFGLPRGFGIGLGAGHTPFNTRNGPFLGLLFVALGAWYADRRPIRARWAAVMIAVGSAVAVAEALTLKRCYGADPWNIDYVVGTVPLGMGVFLLALALPGLGRGTILPRLGQLTLGVYVSHLLFLSFARHAAERLPFPWSEFACPVLLYGVSVVFTLLLCKVKYVRRLLA